jgi:hypothetical protein
LANKIKFSDTGILTCPSEDRFCTSWEMHRRDQVRCSIFLSVNAIEYSSRQLKTGTEFEGKILNGQSKGILTRV